MHKLLLYKVGTEKSQSLYFSRQNTRVLKAHATLSAPPLTDIYSCSLREGKLPNEWKMANIIPLPKVNPPASIYKGIRPISLTPIAAKVLESVVVEWVDDTIVTNVDPKQFGGVAGTSTTDALVEMTYKWYETTDTRNAFVRIVLYLILVRRSI